VVGLGKKIIVGDGGGVKKVLTSPPYNYFWNSPNSVFKTHRSHVLVKHLNSNIYRCINSWGEVIKFTDIDHVSNI